MRVAPAALALALALCAACSGGGGERPTNFLLVVLDTTRADRLGCYGHDGADTPALDRLAARGLRFDQALSASSLTPVSVASMLTGVYPQRHGVRSLFVVDRSSLSWTGPTLFERLQEAGLATAAFVSARPLAAKYGLDRGFAEYHDDMGAVAERNRELGLPSPYQRRADETTELALEWLDRHADRPFGALVHFFDTHDATLVPPRGFLNGRVSFPLPANLDQFGNLSGAGGAPRLEQPEHAVELYEAELSFADRQVARLLDLLERRGVLDDTLVVVIGDHGEGLGQHGFWTHGLLWAEQLRVPLIFAGPGFARGAVVADRVRLVDVLPTVLDAFGLPRAPDIDGVSLAELARGGKEDDAREIYAEVHHAPKDYLGRDTAMHTLTLGTWKFIHRPQTEKHQLYNLSKDPGELRNVYRASHPALTTIHKRLEALGALETYVADTESMPEDELEALRTLGYLGDEPGDH